MSCCKCKCSCRQPVTVAASCVFRTREGFTKRETIRCKEGTYPPRHYRIARMPRHTLGIMSGCGGCCSRNCPGCCLPEPCPPLEVMEFRYSHYCAAADTHIYEEV